MKKLAMGAALLFCMSCVNGQRSIDRLFEKYSDREGFTCITVSGNLLNIEAGYEDEDDGSEKGIKAKITEVRILTQKDHNLNAGNFHNIIMKDIDLDEYDEFMRVKESDQDLRVLVRTQGKRITELLMLAGGNDNAVIQVKGNMSIADARRLCDRKHHEPDIF